MDRYACIHSSVALDVGTTDERGFFAVEAVRELEGAQSADSEGRRATGRTRAAHRDAEYVDFPSSHVRRLRPNPTLTDVPTQPSPLS